MTGAFKKFLAFGSGIGIAVDGPRGAESLRVTAVRVRPNGARIVKQFSIDQFHQRPAAEWGATYSAEISKLGFKHIAAVVMLPRQEVILRQVSIPGVADRDLDAAIAFQLDGMHPWGDDEAGIGSTVLASWARLGETGTVVVAIARREAVDRYVTTFAEAGIKLAGFTCSAPAIYSAQRLFGRAPEPALLVSELEAGSLEVYGESPAKPMFSATFPISSIEPEPDREFTEAQLEALLDKTRREQDRALTMAAAELRIGAETPVRSLKGLIGVDQPLAYAAALQSACPWLALPLNLLPEDLRQGGSPSRLVPSVALVVIIAVFGIGHALTTGYSNAKLLKELNRQIAEVQPAATRSGQLDKEIDLVRARTMSLDRMRVRTKADLDTLSELTRVLPPPTWLRDLDMNEQGVVVTGQTPQAEPLLKVLDESPYFEASEFNSPPTRVDEGESFRLKTKRSANPDAKQPVQSAAVPASPAPAKEGAR